MSGQNGTGGLNGLVIMEQTLTDSAGTERVSGLVLMDRQRLDGLVSGMKLAVYSGSDRLQ